jgi:hypothetical protein
MDDQEIGRRGCTLESPMTADRCKQRNRRSTVDLGVRRTAIRTLAVREIHSLVGKKSVVE